MNQGKRNAKETLTTQTQTLKKRKVLAGEGKEEESLINEKNLTKHLNQFAESQIMKKRDEMQTSTSISKSPERLLNYSKDYSSWSESEELNLTSGTITIDTDFHHLPLTSYSTPMQDSKGRVKKSTSQKPLTAVYSVVWKYGVSKKDKNHGRVYKVQVYLKDGKEEKGAAFIQGTFRWTAQTLKDLEAIWPAVIRTTQDGKSYKVIEDPETRLWVNGTFEWL